MRLITFITLVFLSLQVKANQSNIYFERISPESGFTFNAIISLIEDDNGLLWFACNNRLFHHNTVSLEGYSLYNDSKKFSNPAIAQIVDAGDYIMVCTSSGLYQFCKEDKSFTNVEMFFPDAKIASESSVESLTPINDTQSIIVIERRGYILEKGNKVLSNISSSDIIRNTISYVDRVDGVLLIGTYRGQLYTLDEELSKPVKIFDSGKDYIRTVCKDGNKYLVGYHDQGIDVIDLFGNYIESYNEEETGKNHIHNNMIRRILRRPNGDIWIGTFEGIIIKDKKTSTVIDYESGRGLPHSSIYQMVEGKNGGIWIGTWAGGISYYRDCNYKFKYLKPITKKGLVIENAITAFTEDNDHNIWIASERVGTNLFKAPLDELEQFPSTEISSIFTKQMPKDLKFMAPHYLVALDFTDGIIIHNIKTGQKINTKEDFLKKDMKLKNVIESFAIHDDKIWLFHKKLVSYSLTSGIETFNMPDDIEGNIPKKQKIKAWFVYIDSAYNLWLCTTHGLYVKYKNSDTLKKCLIDHKLENEIIYSCCEDRDGQLWIGTAGEGPFIYHPEKDNTTAIEAKVNLSELDVYSIVRSNDSHMWFSSNNGIYHYEDEKTVARYSKVDGLSGEQYKPNAGFVCSNGQVLFGYLNGYNIITPSIIKKNKTAPQTMLTELSINNAPLSKDNSKEANSQDLYKLNQLTLEHSKNTIALKVINNNFVTPSKNRFKYRLVNYNDEWTEIGKDKEISYTKIPTGSYTFEAYGCNNDGVWSTTPYRLSIRILPALWVRWYFIVAYILLSIGLGYVIYKNIKSKIALLKSIKEEKDKSQLNDAIYQERVKFFVNVSHEIRTPLSLILSPVKSLLAIHKDDTNSERLLKTVERNSRRLLRLTDQTLDFRLLEMGKLKPQLKETDIIELAVDSYSYFEQRILEKGIEFSFSSHFKVLQMLADSEMIEKVIFNLLSNAIDYTHEGGEVKLSINKGKLTDEDYEGIYFTGEQFTGKHIEICIKDSGIGIYKDSIPELFNRFTKLGEVNQSKTGIGLHLCSEYATLNEGNIMVSSSVGEGSTFKLNLPVKDETKMVHGKEKQIISQVIEPEKDTVTEELIDITTTEDDPYIKTILIVDDNKELLTYLKGFFKKTFKVTTAQNTVQALKVLNQITPDVILSELLLKDEVAYTYIENIKSNKRFSNIPIIVLTQLSEKKHQIECLKLGVDAFFNKPIEDTLLLVQINNILKKKVETATIEHETPKPTHINMKSFDRGTFATIAEQIVLDNLQNISFDANTLADKMEVSYSTLFRRLKKETDISATQFIRNIRLKRSKELLKESDLTIDEIGTSIGFNSTSYFVRSFKKKYDQTPTEYRKSI